MSYQLERHQRLTQQAREDFATHQIVKRSEGRWLLRRTYHGEWSNVYRTEIISLDGGALYVGGDIDFVIFGWYSDSANHEAKVRWMGRCDDVRYYVRQKARIGTGGKLIDVYDEEAARETVRDWLSEEKESLDCEFATEDQLNQTREHIATLEEVLSEGWTPWAEREDLINHLAHKLGTNFLCERCYDLGDVLAVRVYYAHAALGRLCELLDEERQAAAG